MIILPVNEKPILRSYLHLAYPVSVMTANNPDSEYWLRSVFLQLYSNVKNPSYKIDFYPLPRYECLDDGHIKGCILNENNVINISKQLLNDGYYLFFIVDEYFIKGTYSYQTTHFDHWLMVHGYDETNLYVAGYLSDRRFQKYTIEYSALLKSINYFHGIGVYKLVDDFDFSYDFIIANELIYDYINSINTSERLRLYRKPIDGLHGRAIYQVMIEDLDSCYDYRYAHVLLEHKENVRYWLKINGVDTKYIRIFSDIIKKCRILEFMYLKQNSDYNNNLKSEIIDLIKSIDDEEQCVLEKCYKLIVG